LLHSEVVQTYGSLVVMVACRDSAAGPFFGKTSWFRGRVAFFVAGFAETPIKTVG